jgi:hypothetical protein
MPLRYPSPEAFAEAVHGSLKDNKRSQEWLAGEAGIPSSTLWSHIGPNAHRLSLLNALRIAEVVDLDPIEAE